jgi:hypothetical protein
VQINELYLEVSDSPNIKVLRVFDTSNYCNDDVIENYLIEVLPVNKSKWLTFHVQKNFSLVLNSSNLGYRKVADISLLRDLPDGIYEFKQSYKPNVHTMQQFLHLRVVELRKKIRKQWDKLVDDTCKLSREEFNTNRDKLREIEEYLMAAKFKVEECHEKKEGKETYEWAVKLLERYTNECQC